MPKTHKGTIERLNRKNKELTLLYEVSKQLAFTIDLNKSISSTLKLIVSYLEMNKIMLAVYEQHTKEFVVKYSYGVSYEEKEKARYKVGEGIIGKVGKSGTPIVIPDIKDEPMFINKMGKELKRGMNSFVAVPVNDDKKVVAVLGAERQFTDNTSFEEDVNLLSMIATLIGLAIKLNQTIEKQRQEMEHEKMELLNELKSKYRPGNIIGISPRIEEVFEIIDKVSPTKATILIRGESGTGKELVAKAIHFHSPRASKPFVKINCAALPETLLESELFGYERGAFTGANELKKGRFEFANEGTIFLDEIGELTPSTQAKLLRVLQERQFERLGGTKTIDIDVRIIAATNKDLENAIIEKKFREDLYYRLNVVPIFMPALRDRKEDIPLLAEHFLRQANGEHGKHCKLSEEAMQFLIEYGWPGNVREFENIMERAVIMAKGAVIGLKDLPIPIAPHNIQVPAQSHAVYKNQESYMLGSMVKNIEKNKIIEALKGSNGIKARASRMLGITQRQLGYKIKKYGISVEVSAVVNDE